MSKLRLGETLETIVEKGEQQLGPLLKDGGKVLGTIGKEILEDLVVDGIEKEIKKLTGPADSVAHPIAQPSPAPHTPAPEAGRGMPPAGAAPQTHAAESVPVPPAPAEQPHAPAHHAHAHGTPSLTGFGSVGPTVRELQRDLGVTVDGIDGPRTTAALKAFQTVHGLQADGIAGPKTWPQLRAEPSLHEGSQGEAVRRIQSQLGVRVDGIDGVQTTAAVETFQKAHGLTPDGIVGIHTWEALDAAAVKAAATDSRPAVPHASSSEVAPKEPTAAPHAEPISTPSPRPGPLPTPPTATHANAIAPPSWGESALTTAKVAYDLTVGGDLKTLGDSKASPLERILAGVDLATSVIDPPKALDEAAIKLGMKAVLKGAGEAGIVAAGEAAAHTETTAPSAAPMHVRYGGEDRPVGDGFRQSGRIVSVQDGIVTQSTGRSAAEYKLGELTAGSRDPAAVEALLVPGRNVQISVEANAFHVANLDLQHERDRTQVQAR